MHTGTGVTAWRKWIPPAARASTFGVRITALPEHPIASARCWSVNSKMIFGRVSAGIVAPPVSLALYASLGAVEACSFQIEDEDALVLQETAEVGAQVAMELGVDL